MKIPLWLIALLLVGYTIWCANFWHSYQVRHCCGDDAALAAGAQSSGVPLFKWNTDKPVEDANFAAWKKSLLAKGGQGDTLAITGYYRSGEADGENSPWPGLLLSATCSRRNFPPAASDSPLLWSKRRSC